MIRLQCPRHRSVGLLWVCLCLPCRTYPSAVTLKSCSLRLGLSYFSSHQCVNLANHKRRFKHAVSAPDSFYHGKFGGFSALNRWYRVGTAGGLFWLKFGRMKVPIRYATQSCCMVGPREKSFFQDEKYFNRRICMSNSSTLKLKYAERTPALSNASDSQFGSVTLRTMAILYL
jgi:hypothetical protein